MLTVRSTINFASQTVPPIIPVVQGDPGRAILFTLADFTIPAGATATYYVQKPSGEAVYNNATIDGNNVLVNLTAQSIIEKGDNYGQVRIAVGGDVVTSFDFILLVKEFRGIEAVQSLTEMNIFDKAVEQAADAIDEVKTDALDDIGDAKDAALQEIEQTTGNFADDFSASATYAAGDYVIHSGQLYRFTANHAAGAWTGSDAEAVTVGEELTDLKADTNTLKEELSDVYIASENLYNPEADTHGVNLNSSGVEITDTAFKTSDYIYVGGGNKITIQTDQNQWKIYFFSAKSDSGYSRSLWIVGTQSSETFTLSASENYIRITMKETVSPFMVNMGDTLLPYAPYGYVAGTFIQDVIDDIEDEISAETAAVRGSSAQKNVINRFDKATISSGYYLATSDGSLVENEDFFASDFIDVSDLTNIWCSRTHIVCFYNANKGFISGQSFDTRSADNDIARPTNTVYMRFSTYLGDLDTAQIGAHVSRADYVPHGDYTLPGFINYKDMVTVAADGSGDYTSFTLACKENYGTKKNIVVKAGTYNIVSEYVAIWGESAVNSMADSSTVFDGWQYGVRLNNRTYTFEPGAKLVCDWTGHTVDGTHRFSALRVEMNVEIVGLDIDCTNTFYVIHDDYGADDEPYTNIYRNCRVFGHSIINANCIGGGCSKYSRHILNNCYFDNNLTESATVRYHNTNAEGAEPEIYVSNCYFNNWFTPRWYGTQTTKMRVYVNNCEARSIHKLAESSNYNVDNVELYKWCNRETNPVT